MRPFGHDVDGAPQIVQLGVVFAAQRLAVREVALQLVACAAGPRVVREPDRLGPWLVVAAAEADFASGPAEAVGPDRLALGTAVVQLADFAAPSYPVSTGRLSAKDL